MGNPPRPRQDGIRQGIACHSQIRRSRENRTADLGGLAQVTSAHWPVTELGGYAGLARHEHGEHSAESGLLWDCLTSRNARPAEWLPAAAGAVTKGVMLLPRPAWEVQAG